MSKHTPGPWEVDRDDSQKVWVKSKAEGWDEEWVALSFSGRAGANARLIAAAPDLLEALKAAKEVVDVAEHMTSCRSDDDFVWGAQKLINAAIAKAEGSS
jgi:hypothetical protein